MPTHSERPVACDLEPGVRARRSETVSRLLRGCTERRELADGYAFRFPGDEEWLAKLASFISSERRCCPFLGFELRLEPDQGPVWLRLMGSGGAKSFMEAVLLEAVEGREGHLREGGGEG